MSSQELLEKYFGYKNFRKNQKEIIDSILSGQDVLAVMPTGAGKSLCYQIPAMGFDGITIVISPLISLMKDQVDALCSNGIPATFINSTLDIDSINNVFDGICRNHYKILYVAPERLDSEWFNSLFDIVKVSQVAIDEAHCVSQWGHDFRPSYRKIASFIERIPSRPVITAFTATASEDVRADILRLLQLISPRVFVSGFDRENLTLTVIKGENRDEYIQRYLNQNKGLSGIIYCATRKNVDKLYEKILAHGYSVGRYHAGLLDNERKINQEDFINDKIEVMVATNAFGMGIDKPNIRFVIHYNMPQNVEGYYQEIGRAGRDGEKSECILLFSPSDIHLQRYLIEKNLLDTDRLNIAYKKLKEITGFVHSNACYRKYILNYFGESTNSDCNNCSNCLTDGDIVDKTIDAQKVLSCIYRMKKSFGVNMVVDVLRGSKSAKIKSFNFDQLSTYGIMKDYTKQELSDFINILISHGYIEQNDGEFPTIALNAASYPILKNIDKVMIKQPRSIEKIISGNELFDKLKSLRYNLAKSAGIPPYIIFGDVSLREMSTILPLTVDDLRNISGASEARINKYGSQFLSVINEFVKIHPTEPMINKHTKINDKDKDKYLNITTNEELFTELKKMREVFAAEQGVYPSHVISQNSLKEISARYPKNFEELKDVSGIGPVKAEQYGTRIIEVVQNYCINNDISPEWSKKRRKKVIIDGEYRDNKTIVLDMLANNISAQNICVETEIPVSTILGYVADDIKETGNNSYNLDIRQYFNEYEEKLILSVCNEQNIDKVSEIKRELPQEISFEKIRAVILKNFYDAK